jgi:hypothetical protein
MKKRIHILLEDDTEILGNGQGHVMYRQYLPVVRYVSILNKFNIKGTFYVDIAHLLFLEKNKHLKDYKLQANIIENTILHLLANKMEIQMHTHSQWLNAKIIDGYINVTEHWNIGLLNIEDQKNIFNNCYACLTTILKNAKNSNSVNSFKAGSWGIQPCETLYDEFKNLGIKIILGPSKDLKIPRLKTNYSQMESDLFPYYCDKKNINKISINKDVVVVPMTPTYLNWLDVIRYIGHKIFKCFVNKYDSDLDIYELPTNINKFNPLEGIHKLNISLKPFQTHVKINAQPFWYLKNTFKRAYKRVVNSKHDYKLIVIETHTKDFKNNFNGIHKFFEFLGKNYKNLHFITSSQLINDIAQGKLKPLSK